MAKHVHIHLHDDKTRDYGVPGMKKGQRKSPEQLLSTHAPGGKATAQGAASLRTGLRGQGYKSRPTRQGGWFEMQHPTTGHTVVIGHEGYLKSNPAKVTSR